MKQLFLLISTLAALTLQAQQTKPVQKILIGFNFSPDYSFRTLKNNDGSPSSDMVINSRNDKELAKFGYTTALNVCINFSKLAAFETGIQFTNKGYKTKSYDLTYIPPSPASPTKAKFTYAYQYLGIPLKLKFSFGKTKARFVAGIGFTTNFLINVRQTNNYEYADGKTEKKSQSTTSGFKKVDISPMISIGIDYKLNDKIHLTAGPVFNYGVLKTTDTPVTENLWNAGLNMGLYYGLK